MRSLSAEKSTHWTAKCAR